MEQQLIYEKRVAKATGRPGRQSPRSSAMSYCPPSRFALEMCRKNRFLESVSRILSSISISGLRSGSSKRSKNFLQSLYFFTWFGFSSFLRAILSPSLFVRMCSGPLAECLLQATTSGFPVSSLPGPQLVGSKIGQNAKWYVRGCDLFSKCIREAWKTIYRLPSISNAAPSSHTHLKLALTDRFNFLRFLRRVTSS